MFGKGVEKVAMFLMVCVVLVAGLFVLRLKNLEVGTFTMPVSPKEAVENYQERIRTTERLLVQERL
ncbi:hypothetical protein HPY86_07320 [candidate division WOR-3 bacterium]|jgi:hypothetical protein|nr:hypothetical protein [candidate division WOR-3 bacterium]